MELQNENERYVCETLDLNRKLTEYEKQNLNHESLMMGEFYRDKFAKLMHRYRCAIYIPYRDYFAQDFFENYHRHMDSENQLQKIMRRYRELVQGGDVDILKIYDRRTHSMLLTNPHALHIYSCSISAYVTYCLLEIAKHRAPIAIIYETECYNQHANLVFADEYIVSTVVGFL